MKTIKLLLRVLLRILFLPLNLIMLGTTACLTLAMDEDWEYWKRYHEGQLAVLPWSSYETVSDVMEKGE